MDAIGTRPAAPPPAHSPNQNRLLAALEPDEWARLAEHLEPFALQLGEMLFEPGSQLMHAHFPTTAVVSLHYVTESGASAETAGVGNEGVVGISLFMGGNTTSASAVVQTAGIAYRLPRAVLASEFHRAGTLRRLLLRYTQSLISQTCQTAACYRHHTVEQQLSRWLLLTLDRNTVDDLIMTQELVANSLGVRRESITEAARHLQELGHIRYRRGHIAVLDRIGLGTRACECYRAIRQESDRLLPLHNAAAGPQA